ncbi:MAG: hypothetical protein MJY94_09065 [Bacteroidales bacterium]|nr:hypothetical protein [Bacteroidales bacterium]
MARKEKSKTSTRWSFKEWLEVIVAIIAIISFVFSIGRWSAKMDHKLELMEIQQLHNTEITNLRIEYNQRLIEANAQSAIEIARLNEEIRSLKSELSNGK